MVWHQTNSTNDDQQWPTSSEHAFYIPMGAMASQITSLTIVYSTVSSGADQRNNQSSASLAFMGGIHWWPVNSLHKRPVTPKKFPFDDIIMKSTGILEMVWHQTDNLHPWWRHQMETFSALLVICAGNSPVPGEFPTQRPVTRSFDVYFDLRPNKWLSKQSWGWWFETLSCSLWRHGNEMRTNNDSVHQNMNSSLDPNEFR